MPQVLQVNNNPSPGHAGPSVYVIEEVAENRCQDDYHMGLNEQNDPNSEEGFPNSELSTRELPLC